MPHKKIRQLFHSFSTVAQSKAEVNEKAKAEAAEEEEEEDEEKEKEEEKKDEQEYNEWRPDFCK
jgi:ribosomal protein L12E/L44/L45/RPP1/RPP2